MVQTVTKNELKEVLMEPRAPGVKEAYHLIKGEEGQDVTILSPGKNGNEFNKTAGYFHPYPGVESFTCVYGTGVIMMQRNDSDGEAKEVRVISLRPGVSVEVPAGYGQCLVNVGKTYLVVITNTIPQTKLYTSSPIEGKKGMAYFLVDKKGDVAFEMNPNYNIHPQIATG